MGLVGIPSACGLIDRIHPNLYAYGADQTCYLLGLFFGRVCNHARTEMIHLPGYGKRLLLLNSKGQHGDLHDFLIGIVVVVDYSDLVKSFSGRGIVFTRSARKTDMRKTPAGIKKNGKRGIPVSRAYFSKKFAVSRVHWPCKLTDFQDLPDNTRLVLSAQRSPVGLLSRYSTLRLNSGWILNVLETVHPLAIAAKPLVFSPN